MKYVNSLKYLNGFSPCVSMSEISSKRAGELCAALGRINVGTNSIFIPGGSAGHSTAVMLENVIKSAGYRVGRITSAFGYDSRRMVVIDGESVPIEDFNKAVAELKAVLKNSEKRYLSEEVLFAVSMLLCRMNDCDYIILEGLSSDEYNLASLCAPYDLVIVPTVDTDGDKPLMPACDAIRHGVREVISGNLKKNAYDGISGACVASGARLNITSRTGFKTEELSSIKLSFSYGDRTGYTLRSPSLLQRECAMLVIEAALAIRRDGVKMPWTAIAQGLADSLSTGCFETLSVSPLILLDSSDGKREAELLSSTLDEVFGLGGPSDLALCIPQSRIDTLPMIEGRKITSLIVIGDKVQAAEAFCNDLKICQSIKDAALHVVNAAKSGQDTLCYGSVMFENDMKTELLKLMNG